MRTTKTVATAATCALLIAMAACGSDDEDPGSGGDDSAAASGSGGSQTIKVGVITPLSGPAAATYGPAARSGVEARIAAYQEEGGECADNDFEIVDADDASNPAGALAATQRLVQQEEVYAILSSSSNFFGATQFVTTQGAGTPVLGDVTDQSPEWREVGNNMFPAQPVPDPEAVYSNTGEFFETIGATTFGGVAFSVPASAAALQSAADSAEAAGLEVGYLNPNVQFGSTDVGPIVLGIKDSGTDGVYLPITFDTALAVVQGLEQEGVETKGILAATGYGADLLDNPVAIEAAQGVSFSIGYAPVSLGTEATERLANAVRDEGVESGIPGYAMSSGWLNADLLLHGLEVAGCDATQQEFIDALNQDDTFDASGLYGQPIDFTVADQAQSCQYYVTLEGEEFVPVEGASPACGERIN
ncbi:ABC transporter substrate-binding protein [Blastococcus sp. URHD0036]|uniref:ABC transporter substrate-binding protein n=1 Tax=Blastococcus sp. URHD0036 TaxID=1380356 RepID=UPI00068F66C6|nr:ABC transporter substrate-binding protein [Blastococcus sp. URHD0036]